MPSLRVPPAASLAGEIMAPADKSITHRALLLAAVSDRSVRVDATLDAEDTQSTVGAVQRCGVEVSGELGGSLEVAGVGLRGLRPPPAIDCGNAGTLMRLLPALLAGQSADHCVLDGDDSLRRRPMDRVARPLRAMGAGVFTAPGGTPPLVVDCRQRLVGCRHELPVASAQVKSCLLLAGLYAEGETWVVEPAPSRDHTERLLEAAGVPLLRDGDAVGVRGPAEGLGLPDMEVPRDFSSAAPLIVAGVLRGDPAVRLPGVNLNARRTGLLAVLERMGAAVTVEDRRHLGGGGEPVGTIVARRATTLHATEIVAHEVPSLIDELPLVALLGAFAAGRTVVRGASELRVKESDRIATVVAVLRALGATIEEREDGFEVEGHPSLRGGEADAAGDHRLAMLGAVAGLASETGVVVSGFEAVGVSYPGFGRDLAALASEGAA